MTNGKTLHEEIKTLHDQKDFVGTFAAALTGLVTPIWRMGDVCVNKFWRSGDKFEIRLWHGDSVWSHIEAHAKPPAKLRLKTPKSRPFSSTPRVEKAAALTFRLVLRAIQPKLRSQSWRV